MQQYGAHLDILAISCDSFDEATNIKIGRGSGDNVAQLFRIRDWCIEYGIKFKLNTVVCRYNFDEDMAERVAELNPFRWKCFQVLMVAGENDSERTLRDVRRFEIDDDEYEIFCKRHEKLPCFIPESNKAMAESYLILDEVSHSLRLEFDQCPFCSNYAMSTCNSCPEPTRTSSQRASQKQVSKMLLKLFSGIKRHFGTGEEYTNGRRKSWAASVVAVEKMQTRSLTGNDISDDTVDIEVSLVETTETVWLDERILFVFRLSVSRIST